MSKLNFQKFWITETIEDGGDQYALMDSVSVYDHRQAIIYYKEGIDVIDELLPNYIKQGYVCEIAFFDKGISIGFSKYTRNQRVDFGLFQMRRCDILSVKEYKSNYLEVARFEKAKHLVKAMGRRGFGLMGALIGALGDNIKVEQNTVFESGVVFEVEYLNASKKNSKISFYCTDKLYNDVGLFFLAFMQKELPNELKKPMN